MSFESELPAAEAYERYLADQLRVEGKTVDPHAGKAAQIAHGDLRVDGTDMEVKFDKQLHVTGNLFVEIEERHCVDGAWVRSGVFAASSAVWYCIGDYVRCWVFLRRRLREESAQQRVFEIDQRTSRGWLLKPTLRDRLAVAARRWLGRLPLGDPIVTCTEEDMVQLGKEIRWEI